MGSVLVTASYGLYGQRAARIGPYRICRIRLFASVSAAFFQRRHRSHCAKPTRVRSGRPGQRLAKRIWSGSKLLCRNHRDRFLAGRIRTAASFPLSDSVAFFHRRSGYYCAKPARIRFKLVLADCVRFWPLKRIRSGSEPMRTNVPARFWPMLPIRSGLDATESYPACLLVQNDAHITPVFRAAKRRSSKDDPESGNKDPLLGEWAWLVGWLKLFNVEVCPKRRWRGPRSQEVREWGDSS